MTIAFLIAAALAVAFCLVAIVHRSPVVNVLSLVIAFFALAAIYALIGMDFLAAIQLIVYSGAVLVLFLFVIMLLNIQSTPRFGSGRKIQTLVGALVAVGFLVVLGSATTMVLGGTGAVIPGAEGGTAFPIGRALMTTHLFAFEFVSLLLLASLVGALVLVRKEQR